MGDTTIEITLLAAICKFCDFLVLRSVNVFVGDISFTCLNTASQRGFEFFRLCSKWTFSCLTVVCERLLVPVLCIGFFKKKFSIYRVTFLSGLVEVPIDAFLFLGVTVCGCSLAFLALCFWCHRKRKVNRRRRFLSRIRRGPEMRLGASRLSLSSATAPDSFRHVCDDSRERFSIVDSVWFAAKSFPISLLTEWQKFGGNFDFKS